jgi:hypothetical protein
MVSRLLDAGYRVTVTDLNTRVVKADFYYPQPALLSSRLELPPGVMRAALGAVRAPNRVVTITLELT